MLNDICDLKDNVNYALDFKLSSFGRNADDILNSFQTMQDNGTSIYETDFKK